MGAEGLLQGPGRKCYQVAEAAAVLFEGGCLIKAVAYCTLLHPCTHSPFTAGSWHVVGVGKLKVSRKGDRQRHKELTGHSF